MRGSIVRVSRTPAATARTWRALPLLLALLLVGGLLCGALLSGASVVHAADVIAHATDVTARGTRVTAPAAEAMAQAAEAMARAADVTAHASVDRPAIWVADRVTYTIDLTCAKGFDILIDDLSRDRLKLAGLDIVSSDVARDVKGDETRYTFRYVLTTYRVDLATLTIAPVPVRYFVRRPGMRQEDAVPAGTVQVPGAAVARRSLLLDDQPTYEIRDRRPAAARPALFAWMQPIGIGLLLLSAAPVVLVAIGVSRRLYAQRGVVRSPSARQVRQALRERLDVVRQLDPSDAAERRDAFGQLDALVREHLRAVANVPASSLTCREIVQELEPRGERDPASSHASSFATDPRSWLRPREAVRIDLVRNILSTCELARYAPPDRLPTADAWRDALADAEQVLATR
jgi:hypothetical protein